MSFETYLVSPVLTEPAAFRARLEAALRLLNPASLLLDVPPGEERAQINLIKALAPLAQEAGVAVLVNTAPQVAVRGGADGVHVASPLLVGPAREALKAERIVGAGGLAARHDAMDAGEAGADYVMFGEPRADGTVMTLSALVDRASWWAEVFETPCVAWAASAGAVEPLAATRSEFVALGPWCFEDAAAAAAAVSEARARIAARGKQPA
ncbi:MAG: thiamine phosphate synthase [Bosea sp.]|jgi:thiamine-phosphate pyrophosphorylase|nr:thiamine phosphate synthase [Bosea sp. (in: a-proteobacteria)]